MTACGRKQPFEWLYTQWLLMTQSGRSRVPWSIPIEAPVKLDYMYRYGAGVTTQRRMEQSSVSVPTRLHDLIVT
jgi:hypothetical protein